MKLELVTNHIPAETIAALEQLYMDAVQGEYTGFVIGLLRPRRRFSVHCVGEACDSPHWSRTICLSIDDKLRAMIESEGHTTYF